MPENSSHVAELLDLDWLAEMKWALFKALKPCLHQHRKQLGLSPEPSVLPPARRGKWPLWVVNGHWQLM